MTSTHASATPEPLLTPQALHREAMVQLQKSLKHHRQAAICHASGDAAKAATHATMAFDRAAHAVEISGRALCVQPMVHRPHQPPRALSWERLVVALANLRRSGRST